MAKADCTGCEGEEAANDPKAKAPADRRYSAEAAEGEAADPRRSPSDACRARQGDFRTQPSDDLGNASHARLHGAGRGNEEAEQPFAEETPPTRSIALDKRQTGHDAHSAERQDLAREICRPNEAAPRGAVNAKGKQAKACFPLFTSAVIGFPACTARIL